MFFALEPEICNNTISDNFLSDEISLERSGEAGVLVFDGSSLGCDAHPEILQRLAAKVTGCVGVGELGLRYFVESARTRHHKQPLDPSPGPGSIDKRLKGCVDLVGFAAP